MKTIIAQLNLSDDHSAKTRDRCPSVIFTDESGQSTAFRTDTEQPVLPYPNDAIDELVICDDALSRVIDEQAWLAELHRIVAPGAIIRLTVPAEGALAWLDTMNIYRYIADISKRGDAPNAALPTGWNRHYRQEDIVRLISDAGFTDIIIQSQNHMLREAGFLGNLLWRNWIKRDVDAEQDLFSRFGQRDPRNRTLLPTTTWSISAHKQHN